MHYTLKPKYEQKKIAEWLSRFYIAENENNGFSVISLTISFIIRLILIIIMNQYHFSLPDMKKIKQAPQSKHSFIRNRVIGSLVGLALGDSIQVRFFSEKSHLRTF